MPETLPTTGRVLSCQDYPGGYRLLRAAARLAVDLRPGHWLRIDSAAWAVLQTAPQQGWADCLQRGAPAPAPAPAPGREASISGPFGEPFEIDATTPRALLLADNDGIAPVVFLARALRARRPRIKSFALFELTPPLPFRPPPSRIMTPGLPAGVIAALPLLEDGSIPSRIACPTSDAPPGCFEGAVAELAKSWLDVAQGVADVTVFACGGSKLLTVARALTEAYDLPCQTRALLQDP